MLHANIEAAEVASTSPAALQAGLATLAAGLDARFIRAGTTLATAVETIDRVLIVLRSVTDALSEHTAGAAVTSLQKVACELSGLPAAQAARVDGMNRVAGASKALGECILEIHASLRVLHIYGVNIKIAASGDEAFVAFVDRMGTRLAYGEHQLDGFLSKLKELTAGVASAQQAERLLAKECAKVVPQVPDKLSRDAGELHAQLANSAAVAQKIAAIASGVQGRVAAMLGAIQVGDSTRQRLEHIVSALQMLEARDQDLEGDPAVALAVTGHVNQLLAAQLEAAIIDFDRETSLLIASLNGLRPDVAALLTLIEEDIEGESRASLARLEQGIAEVDHVTSQVRGADERSKAMGKVINDAVEDLTSRTASIHRIQLEVQDISTNTRILCRRHGAIGRAVSIIATEIDTYAEKLGEAVQGIRRPIQELGLVNLLRGASTGEVDMGYRLCDALRIIRMGCQQTERATREGGDDARQLASLLGNVGAELSSEMAVSGTMRSVVTALSAAEAIDPLPEAAELALRVLLPRIATLYTMAQEREVHIKYLLPGMEAATSAAVAEPDEDDDGLF